MKSCDSAAPAAVAASAAAASAAAAAAAAAASCAGVVLPSILLVHGQYARLENISADGCWLATEEFVVQDRLVVHTAGQSVGNLMLPWC